MPDSTRLPLPILVSENGVEYEITDVKAREDISSLTNIVNGKLGKEELDSETARAELAESTLNQRMDSVEGFIGYESSNDSSIIGLQIDYANKSFKRLAGAVGLSAGKDFNKYNMYGKRRRCTLADDGTVIAYCGEDNYKEDGSNGQVMVEQPKFYYKRVPLKLEKISGGIGYHIRKENIYLSDTLREGFKLHPAFYDENDREIDFVYESAYEGSIFDTSAGAYLKMDEQVMDETTDKFCSIAEVKPASGLTQKLTRVNIEQLAKNRGTGWHGDTIKMVSMCQLLMIVELGTMNSQSAIGKGVVSITDSSNYNCSSLTGSTMGLGNNTGSATSTVNEVGGVKTAYTEDGKVSISYRGKENVWGNIWKSINGINIYGNGSTLGGVPYVCRDFNFEESKSTDNYESAGFTLSNNDGYISAMGYAESFDWLFMPSECLNANSALPVGDFSWVTANLDKFRMVRIDGGWSENVTVGIFGWCLHNDGGYRNRVMGCRMVYVPQSKV